MSGKPMPDSSEPVILTLKEPVTCNHCRAEYSIGIGLVVHCIYCNWWTCASCSARNGKWVHLHKDHPKCPAKGKK